MPPARDLAATCSATSPTGVPPLELTGERTLPDVPEENYWFRRHLVVYGGSPRRSRAATWWTWPAARATASAVLAARAASVVGVDANPDAHEHARLRYRRPNLRFERDLVENVAGPCDAVVVPADDRAHAGAGRRCSSHFAALAAAGRGRVHLHAQPPHAGSAGRGALGQPVARARVPRRGVRGPAAARTSRRSRCLACSTPASCAPTSWRSRLGWDASTAAGDHAAASTSASRRPSAARDFRLRAGEPARLTRALDFVAVCRP